MTYVSKKVKIMICVTKPAILPVMISSTNTPKLITSDFTEKCPLTAYILRRHITTASNYGKEEDKNLNNQYAKMYIYNEISQIAGVYY